jgi:hypothetical protein
MISRFHILLLVVFFLGCKTNLAPTGGSETDGVGLWSGGLSDTSLLGRSLSGDVDWRFEHRTFEIFFFDPPPGQAAQIIGDWDFSNERLVLILRSSFPIADDAGVTDSLFVSILGGQMSIKTQAGSDILLQKIQGFAHVLPFHAFRKTELFGT